jgi:hypothetical protein
MNGIQTVLIGKMNKLKCGKDEKFNVHHCTPSEPTAYPRGYAYHQMEPTGLERGRAAVHFNSGVGGGHLKSPRMS